MLEITEKDLIYFDKIHYAMLTVSYKPKIQTSRALY